MPITELPQPTTPNALLTFDGGALTVSLTSGAVSSPRAAIATSTDLASSLTDGVAWWIPGVSGSPWLLGYSRFDVTGGTGNDSLGAGILGALDDTIRGGAGDDTITGAAAGRDVLDGGPGRDTLVWSWAALSNPLTVTLAQAAAAMTVDVTAITGFETLRLALGTAGDIVDARGMGAAAPLEIRINGGAGNDTFLVDASVGTLYLSGGPGIDALIGDFSALTTPVTWKGRPSTLSAIDGSLEFGTSGVYFMDLASSGDGTSIPEQLNLRLGAGDDSVWGSTVDGSAGNDTISGTLGDDILDGGVGIDTVVIVGRLDIPFRLGVTTPQSTGEGRGVGAYLGLDTVLNFENVDVSSGYGSLGAWVIGDAGPNRLAAANDPARISQFRFEGMAGDDTLTGSAGHDTLIGGTGTNSVTGGTGSDTLIIDGARRAGSLTITPDAPISNGLSGASASVQGSYAGARETTAFTGIETLSFTDGRLTFDPGDVAFQASRLYQVAFNRVPDAYGLNFWIDALAAGASLASVARGFTLSTEFRDLYGVMDNAGFVTALYQNALGRAPDTPGLSFWTQSLAGGASRESVLIGFAESTEFKGNHLAANITGIWDQDDASASIARLYQATLNRRPEEAGLHDWRAEMAAGKSLADLVPGFTNSVEFATLYGATSNQAFVTLLYNNVLARAPDAAGLAGWVAQLDAGGTRTDVVLGFSESLEFRLSTMAWIEGGVVFA